MARDSDIDAMIARVALGDREAFSDLYDETSARVAGIVSRIIPVPEIAEEVIFQTFLKIRRYAERYTPNSMRALIWIDTIARNTAVDRRRQMKENGEVGAAGDSFILSSRAADAAAQGKRKRPDIVEAMAPLAEDRRAAIRGAFQHGLNYDDLAEQLEVDTRTMQTWLRTSLKTMIDELPQ